MYTFMYTYVMYNILFQLKFNKFIARYFSNFTCYIGVYLIVACVPNYNTFCIITYFPNNCFFKAIISLKNNL